MPAYHLMGPDLDGMADAVEDVVSSLADEDSSAAAAAADVDANLSKWLPIANEVLAALHDMLGRARPLEASLAALGLSGALDDAEKARLARQIDDFMLACQVNRHAIISACAEASGEPPYALASTVQTLALDSFTHAQIVFDDPDRPAEPRLSVPTPAGILHAGYMGDGEADGVEVYLELADGSGCKQMAVCEAVSGKLPHTIVYDGLEGDPLCIKLACEENGDTFDYPGANGRRCTPRA